VYMCGVWAPPGIVHVTHDQDTRYCNTSGYICTRYCKIYIRILDTAIHLFTAHHCTSSIQAYKQKDKIYSATLKSVLKDE